MKSEMKNRLILKTPSAWWGARWREALPSGNGTIGAAVYGGVYDESVMLTHADLWFNSFTQELPDVSDKLSEVRQLLDEERAREADKLLERTLIERGYQPRVGSPLPLSDLKVVMDCHQAFKSYKRELNMESGEITVSWSDGETRFERSLFVSRADDMIVMKIRKSGPGSINVKLSLERHIKELEQFKSSTDIPTNLETVIQDNYIYYAARNDDGTDFGAVARVIANHGEIEYSSGHMQIYHADDVLVCIKLFVQGDRGSARQQLSRELAQVRLDYDELLIRHSELHGALFNSLSFDIFAEDHHKSNEELLLEAYQGKASLALIEKMWSYGRYMLISSSREGGQPCHLYGLWCGEYNAIWAFNMLNENLQMIYWQALSGNMSELLLAVFDFCERLMDDFRTNANRLYGCRGIYIPAPITPESGLIKILYPHIIHWTGGAGWIAQHYYDYYLHTEDRKFLVDRALPFMREAALFYEDFFVIGPDGTYISSPSNSPENSPANYWDGRGMGNAMETTVNATMDFAISKELITNLIEGSRIAGVYQDEIAKWEIMLKNIPPYQLNEDGAIKEWMHPHFIDNDHHRHLSHIYPLFPGNEIRKDHPLYDALLRAVDNRKVIGLNETTGWSLAHMANIYARTGDGDRALECLDILSRSCVQNNFYTTHNDWRNMGIGVDMMLAPVCLDANMGWSAAMQEMVMFSMPGRLILLPGLPTSWRRGRVGSLLARGGVEVSIEWDLDEGKIETVLCSRNKDQKVEVSVHQIDSQNVRLKQGEAYRLTFNIGQVKQVL